MTESEAAKIVAVLQATWPQHKWTEHSDQAYLLGLADLPYDLVLQTVALAIKTRTFCPVPAELRRIIVDASTAIPTAAEAWEVVMGQIRERWPDEGPDPATPPLILRAIKAVGWHQLVLCDVAKLGYERAAFIEIYGAFRDKALERHNLEGIAAGVTMPALAGSTS